MMRARALRVVIVDDHPAVCEGLNLCLAAQPDFEVCGTAQDLDDAITLVDRQKPDLAVIDVVLKSSSGIQLVKQLSTRLPPIRMLVWSMHESAVYAPRARRAGASGFLNKQQATSDVADALREIADGGQWFSPGEDWEVQALDQPIIHRLSDRELEVFRLIGTGLTTNEIAQRLTVSVKTVETHRQRIKIKMRFRNSVELGRQAVQYVLENG